MFESYRLHISSFFHFKYEYFLLALLPYSSSIELGCTVIDSWSKKNHQSRLSHFSTNSIHEMNSEKNKAKGHHSVQFKWTMIR